MSDSSLHALARLCGFVKRRPRRLDLRAFLLSCLLLAWQQSCSLRKQAIFAGICSATTLSKQALHKRLAAGAGSFLQACLGAALGHRLARERTGIAPVGFARVLVQDSTCLSLSARLARRFPGAANQSGQTQAGLRLQCLYDLLSERFVWFRLGAFTRNDQAAAADVLPLLHADDLLVRDLGYFTLGSLHGITAAGAFFLTRLRYGLSLWCPDSGEPLQLSRLLRADANVDRPVLLGLQRVPVRLLAFPLSEPAANERRRKARADRDKRLRHSNDYLHLLGWAIFITNAPAQRLPKSIVAKLYRLRWRIEILFKAFKSHLALTAIHSVGERQVEPLLYGALLFVVLTHLQPILSPADRPSPPPGHAAATPALSLLRFSAFCADWMLVVLFACLPFGELFERLRAQIHKHARYDSRRRPNYIDSRTHALG